MPEFSLYVHVPYCRSKCPYCDFNSYAPATWPEREYTAALIRELRNYAVRPPWQGATLQTVFFGGGTPSLFASQSIAEVLGAIDRLWPARPTVDDGLPTAAEVTLEANPGTVAAEKLHGLRAAGVNRISFGVQSFCDRHLRRLGRIHSAAEALATVESARTAGFDNVNLDLIFAVPEQTLEEWRADLRASISVGPEHISTYGLTYEQGTVFHDLRAERRLRPVPEEVEIEMLTAAQDILAAAGYQHYEISNYARRGRECRHNLNYWRGGAYLGVGAGAHSFVRVPSPGGRWSNEKNPDLFIERVHCNGHARVFEETLTGSQAQGEFVFLGLRLREGLDSDDFAERFGVPFTSAFPHTRSLEREGLLVADGSRFRLSRRGLLLADGVFATFL